METPLPEVKQSPSVIDRVTSTLKAAGKRVVDQYRSDSVVSQWDNAIERVVGGYHPELPPQERAEQAKRFHLLAQGMGAAASTTDLLLTAVGLGKGGSDLFSLRRWKPTTIAAVGGEAVISAGVSPKQVDTMVLRRPIMSSLPAFGLAAGATLMRPARFFLELMGKGAGYGGEKVAGIIRRITQGM